MEVRLKSKPWEPQDLLDDLQLLIDEQPNHYTNGTRATLCEAHAYLQEFFGYGLDRVREVMGFSYEEGQPVELFRVEHVYNDKRKFIRDFVAQCRSMRKSGQKENVTLTFQVCDEFWIFTINTEPGIVTTEATLLIDDQWVSFPETTWGEPYVRWDSDLIGFLSREVCKEK